jgi:glycerol dehydrogenase-like iron-containing ADH family enzyme
LLRWQSVQEAWLEEALAGLPSTTTVVAGIGGGQAVDAAKYFSWRRGLRVRGTALPLVSLPSACRLP